MLSVSQAADNNALSASVTCLIQMFEREEEIEKRGMVLHKRNDEIDKRELAIHDDQIDLLMKQVEVQCSRTLLHVYWGFAIVISCYLIGSK